MNQIQPAPRTPYHSRLRRLAKSIGEEPTREKENFDFSESPQSGEDHELHMLIHEKMRGSLTVKTAQGNADARRQLALLETHIAETEELIKAEGYNSRGTRRMRIRYFEATDKAKAKMIRASKPTPKNKQPKPKMPAKLKDIPKRYRPAQWSGKANNGVSTTYERLTKMAERLEPKQAAPAEKNLTAEVARRFRQLINRTSVTAAR